MSSTQIRLTGSVVTPADILAEMSCFLSMAEGISRVDVLTARDRRIRAVGRLWPVSPFRDSGWVCRERMSVQG